MTRTAQDKGLSPDNAGTVPVADFRRQSMVLEWQSNGGTWTACDEPPVLVHGVALIRASQPNICLFARDNQLQLQVGGERFALAKDSPRLSWSRDLATFGLRREFTVTNETSVALQHTYWNGQGDDFFTWLTTRAVNPEWRMTTARHWSEGVHPNALRSS